MDQIHVQPVPGSSEVPLPYDEATRGSSSARPSTQLRTISADAPIHGTFTGTQINPTNLSSQYGQAGSTGMSVPPESRAGAHSSMTPSEVAKGSTDDQFLDQALEFTRNRPPPSSASARLPRPIAIPQVAARLGMPFARAYSSALQDRGISMDEFVEFIDNLNVVSTASPPLQVLDLAGGVVSMVPHHIPMIVGNAISFASKLGTGAVSKGRAAMFLKKANSDFFAPRRLKVELATSKALKAKLGLDPNAELVSSLEDSVGLDIQQRRLRALEGYISPLTFDVPPPNKQTNALERMSAWQVQRQLQTSEKKALKDREKAIEKDRSSDGSSQAQNGSDKEIAKVEKDKSKIEKKFDKDSRKGGKRAEKAARKRDRKMQKIDHEVEKVYDGSENDTGKKEKDAAKDDKEIGQANRVLWLLVEDL